MKNFKNIILLMMLLLPSIYMQAVSSNQTKVNQKAVVRVGDARFTVITPRVIRMEWDSTKLFNDQASFLAVNRNLQVPQFTQGVKGGWLTIKTSEAELNYKVGSGRFTPKNIRVKFLKDNKSVIWKFGDVQKGNLKGTYRTLDGYNGGIHEHDNKPMPIEDGLLSTDGWTFIDDSKNYLFDNSDWPWVAERKNKAGQDFYFMAYGHNYKSALKDFTTFSGKVPLPPRYTFGYWWSRYWSYSDNELRNLIDNFNTYNIPLDVLVVDMDWHYTEAGKGGWTGYTWNRRLFPDPDGFLKYLKQNKLQITLNLHPADGIANYEENFPAMAKWMGVNPDSTKQIPYEGSNKQFMSGWFNTILRPMEKKGIDFWWLDWQQKLNDGKFKDLSNTWWINYVVFSDMERNRETRPLLYHRWGGLGNHRYQIGFSGDSYISWASLDFQPYFNSTASNVLYGYWSHDIGGHMGANNIDPELYVRWLQFGALSPILRTHSTKNSNLNKEPWAFSQKYLEVIRNTVLERYQMAPYVYTMARKTYDEALSICRPMYYDYPENKEAYDYKNEYMFGDNLLVCPITSPMKNDKSTVTVWLPEGNDWYEWHTGTLLKGGQSIERTFNLDEYPIYVKAGSILPLYDKVKNLQNNDEPVTVTVFPGKQGSFEMYEDNGNDKDYATHYAKTLLSTEKVGNVLTVKISARQGSYPDMPSSRNFKVKVLASAVPESVMVNGVLTDFTYDGNDLSLTVNVPETDCSKEKVLKINYPTDAPEVTDGLQAQMRHVRAAVLQLKQKQAGIVLNEELGTMESAGGCITYYPNQFKQRIEAFRANYANLPAVLQAHKLNQETIDWFINAVK